MGKNTNKPVRFPSGGGGGGDFEPEQKEQAFHSSEFEQQHLESLLNPVERLTWDQFKEQQRQKGLLEGAEERKAEEERKQFRKELDDA